MGAADIYVGVLWRGIIGAYQAISCIGLALLHHTANVQVVLVESNGDCGARWVSTIVLFIATRMMA
jgi:hypothetical protein